MRERIDEAAWRPQIEQRSHGLGRFPPGRRAPPQATATGVVIVFPHPMVTENDRKGTLIRHARPAPALAILLLPVAMIEPAFGALLMTAVGRAVLPAPGFGCDTPRCSSAARDRNGTNPEHRPASLAAANPLPENNFSVNRHPRSQADFDNGNGSCQRKTSFDGGLLMKVA